MLWAVSWVLSGLTCCTSKQQASPLFTLSVNTRAYTGMTGAMGGKLGAVRSDIMIQEVAVQSNQNPNGVNLKSYLRLFQVMPHLGL